jgi:hypothetical protein
MSEGWHQVSSTLGTHNSEVTCKPQCYLVVAAWCLWTDDYSYMSGRKLTVIMFKILGATIQTRSYLAHQMHGICGTLLYHWNRIQQNDLGHVSKWQFFKPCITLFTNHNDTKVTAKNNSEFHHKSTHWITCCCQHQCSVFSCLMQHWFLQCWDVQ